MNNRSFVRALLALAHPVTIGAVLLWLLNDHILKAAWPSWWTGKLSDVAGLIVAPLLLAVPLSWLLPWRMKGHERVVGWLAVGAVGAWWALVVTLPDVHQLSLRVLSFATGTDFHFERDPSDIIALPTLCLAWYVWRRPMPRTSALMARGLLVAMLSVITSLATSYPPSDDGVGCIFEQDGAIYAGGFAGIHAAGFEGLYRSDDSGQSWQRLTDSEDRVVRQSQKGNPCGAQDPREFFAPDSPAVRYRISVGSVIERSGDGGQTWRREFDLSRVNHEARLLVRQEQARVSRFGAVVKPGPLGAMVQQGTGVVVLAMGHDGALVRNTSGIWQWVTVGPYRYKGIDLGSVAGFLGLQIVLGVVLAPLVVATMLAIAGGSWRSGWVAATLLAVAWVAWGVAAIAALGYQLALNMFPPPLTSRLEFLVTFWPLTLLALVVGVIRAVQEIRDMRRRFDKAGSAVALWTGSGFILFLLSYVLWAGMALGSGSVVLVFSLVLTAANIVAASLYLRKHLRPNTGGSSERLQPPQEVRS